MRCYHLILKQWLSQELTQPRWTREGCVTAEFLHLHKKILITIIYCINVFRHIVFIRFRFVVNRIAQALDESSYNKENFQLSNRNNNINRSS